MVHRVVQFALRQRAAVVVATVLIALLGLNAFRRLPIEAYPDVADTMVQVITQWPGHAAEEVERQISAPVERAMNGVPEHTVVRSTSLAGLSVVTLAFEDGTDSYFARQQALERLKGIDLPDDASSELGPLASPIGEILRYRLVNCAERRTPECSDSDSRVAPISLTELKQLEEWVVERELLGISGVADVSSFGGTVKQYHVVADPALLIARGLTLSDVEQALTGANANAGGGIVNLGPAALNVRGIGLLEPGDIGSVAIATRKGTSVRVRDVASVQVGYQPRLGRVSLDKDTDVVAATVLLRKGDHAEAVLERVHERIQEVNERVLPRGVKLSPYHDRSDLMHQTTRTVLDNLADGIVLVSVVLLLFLGSFRAALIAALTIPLSLLFAFICMDAADIPANLLSIGAVDFGMIVDGSIVMVENVFRRIKENHERGIDFDLVNLVREAASEVARPIVFAIIVIICAYLPIFTLERVEGKLFRPMAWTVAFALGGAVLFAVTIVPVLTTLLLRGRVREFRNPFLEVVRRGYLPSLRRVLSRPKLVVLVTAALLLVDLTATRLIGSEFLPHLNEGALWVRATMPANISLEEAERIVDGSSPGQSRARGLREILGAFPEIRVQAVQLGRPDDGTDATGFYNAEFLLVLRDRAEWRPQFGGDRERLEEAMSRALAVVPGVEFGFSQPISDNVEEALTGVKGQLAVKISGSDLHALDDLASRVAREIANVSGVVDLGVFRELGQSNLNIEISRARAEPYGLSVDDVQHVIDAGIGGRVVTQITEGERKVDLVVRFSASSRQDADAIRRLPIPIEAGHTIPLAEVATVSVQGGASNIYRENGRRYIAIKFGVRERDLGSTVAEAQARVARAVKLPDGYDMQWSGEFESARRAGKRLAIVVPATLALIFIVLFVMFRRPHEPLLILGNVLVTSPCGGLVALLATGTNFSVSSGVGFLALFGVSVQTGVILVTYMNELRAQGLGLDEAIVSAADRRLRPVMMTALVATLGLLPAALSNGIGSDSQKPLAIVVVGGLLSSLALSLFTLPLIYRLFPPRLSDPLAAPPQIVDGDAVAQETPA
jgi:heavy metal efflux system protein